jgi:hypothetical protein
MFEALENNPTLRDRVLGLTAIGAILVGGAVGIDTMLTSGWQIGGTGGAPVVYAETTPQQYFDDVGRDWTTARPQRVQLATQDAVVTIDPTQSAGGLDGSTSAVITPASAAPTQSPQPTPASGADAQQRTTDQQFEAIERDVHQATMALTPDAAKDDLSPPPSANDQG